VRAANNQPAVKMVVPDYHSTASSSTQLPSQHPLRQHFRERLGCGTDLSTVLPTPLNHRHHLLSPVRTETPSHGYTLRIPLKGLSVRALKATVSVGLWLEETEV
jgi:hypothetical protein